MIESLILLYQIVEPASIRALIMTQGVIFSGRATLLLPMMIVVKDRGSQAVVFIVIYPSRLMVKRMVLALSRVFTFQQVVLLLLTFVELCHVKVMVRDSWNLLSLLIVNGCPKTSSGVLLRQ